MDNNINMEYFQKIGLLPHQAKFAYDFLVSEDKPIWELIAPTGTGKTRLASAIIAHEMKKNSHKRILVLSPRSTLLYHWKFEISSELKKIGLASDVLVIGIKTYFELKELKQDKVIPWPSQTIILMSIDFAKRDDVLTDLSRVVWDLIIFDESHLFSVGKRRLLFETLSRFDRSHRSLLLTNFPREPINKFINQTRIERTDLVDWLGNPLFVSYNIELTYINYQRSDKEVAFLKNTVEFVRQVANNWSYGIVENILFQAASSCIYALEETLLRILDVWQNIRNKIAHNISITNEDMYEFRRKLRMISDDLGLEEELSNDISIPSPPKNFLFLYQKLESLIEQIDEIEVDTKLNTLISQLQDQYIKNEHTYICIWSSYLSTIKYIGNILPDSSLPIYSITHDLTLNERLNVLKSFEQNSGILLITDIVSQGLSLSYVDECINYDLPLNIKRFEQRLGRFYRHGRKSDFKMTFLKDISEVLTWEVIQSRLIEKEFFIKENI